MELKQDDIQKYIELGNKIDTVVKRYYNENIYNKYCGYEFMYWELIGNNNVRILYSFEDFHGERCCDERTLTLKELNLNQ